MPDDEQLSSDRITYPIPTRTDGTVLTWDSNDAHLPGLIHEFSKWVTRTGHFRALFEHHAVPISNGKLAVDSVAAVTFVMGPSGCGKSTLFKMVLGIEHKATGKIYTVIDGKPTPSRS